MLMIDNMTLGRLLHSAIENDMLRAALAERDAYIADLRDAREELEAEVAALEGEIDALETEAIDAGSSCTADHAEPPALHPDEHAALTRIARELRDAPHARGQIMASLSWRGSPRFETWIGRILAATNTRAVAATADALRAELAGRA